MSILPRFKAAAVHAAPVFLDRAATTEKICALIREAAANGAELVAFAETFLPAFPVWAALRAPIDNHDWFARMAAESVLVPGPEIEAVAKAARGAGVFVSLGVSEKNPASVGGMWNSNVLLSDRGEILNVHRKLVPTFYEKLVWSHGDGHGLRVCDTRLGKLGALICGENTNPLARFSLMAQGEQVHVSCWPPVWPTKRPSTGENYDLAGAVRLRAGAHCFEAKCFGIVVSSFMDRAMRDALVRDEPAVADVVDRSPRGVSMFIGPDGSQFGDTLQDAEGILYGEIDLARCVEPKQFHDVVGSYNRFDVFDLKVNRQRLEPATFNDSRAPADTGAAPAA